MTSEDHIDFAGSMYAILRLQQQELKQLRKEMDDVQKRLDSTREELAFCKSMTHYHASSENP